MASSASKALQFSNIAATTAGVAYLGGKSASTVHATFGGGSVQWQILALDGSTWINVGSSITSDNFVVLGDLPQGQYRLSVTTATGVYASLVTVPGES
jgi:hypothetical protein